ncbi:MAG: flagellar biosynthetic protein FliR [Candidatus Aureabacteria bacterium]|nr:flagellar biosynthetic protein FliR [Candidatus Auribacterota bacterium]
MTYAELNGYFIKMIGFMLILMRISGAFFLAPVFGSDNVLNQIKIWIAVFISLVILPTISMQSISRDITFTVFLIYSIKEITVGAILGFLTNMPFVATRVGAEIAGRMSGFGMGRVINPDVDENVSLLSQYVYITVVLFFLYMDGHHIVLNVLAKSFELIPLGKNVFPAKATALTFDLYSYVFNIGVAYGAPTLGILLIISLTMGILGKTVPQLNVMIFVLPIRVAAGLLGIMLTFPFLYVILKKITVFTEKCSAAIVLYMSGG